MKALGPQHETAPDIKLLINAAGQEPPTAANIRSALSAITNRADARDTIVVFIAGHGVMDRKRVHYKFLPTDARLDGDDWDGAATINWVEIEQAVFGASGRRLLFIDTCHSSGAYNNRLGQGANAIDVVAFTATGRDQPALEFSALKHGVFTYALMAGLGGEADTDGSKLITVDKLGVFLKAKTAALIQANGHNQPQPWPIPELHKARDAGNHVLARVK